MPNWPPSVLWVRFGLLDCSSPIALLLCTLATVFSLSGFGYEWIAPCALGSNSQLDLSSECMELAPFQQFVNLWVGRDSRGWGGTTNGSEAGNALKPLPADVSVLECSWDFASWIPRGKEWSWKANEWGEGWGRGYEWSSLLGLALPCLLQRGPQAGREQRSRGRGCPEGGA